MTRIHQLWELAIQFRYEQDYPEGLLDEDFEVYNQLVALSFWKFSYLDDRLDIIRWEHENIEQLSELAELVLDEYSLEKWRSLLEFEEVCDQRKNHEGDNVD